MKNIYIIIFSIFIALSVVMGQSTDSTNSEKKKEQVQSKSEEQQRKKSTEQEGKQLKQQKGTREDQETGRDVQPQGSEQKLEGFVDTNGNGIDDRLEAGGKGYRKGKNAPRDRFVDTDGDGICDGKESAIGLRKLYRKRKGNPGNK
jgi:hypothetical protein